MKLSHLVEYAGLRLLMSLTRRLSPVRATRVGDILGDLVFHVTGIRKKLVMEHLVRIYGETGDDSKRQATARSIYRQLGRTAVEHARLLAGRTPDLRDRIAISGEEHVARARQGGRGVILVTGHFGYWELLGATVAFLGYPISVVAKKLHNPAVDRLVHEGRERLGMAVTPMDSAPSAIFRALRRNECVGLLADQDAGAGGVFVEFLGSGASTYQGPALFALRTGAPIVPCFIIRSGPECHRVCFETPIEAIATGDEPADIVRTTQAYTDVLARYILDYPDHWFWVHRRWKTPAPADSNHVQ
ncbi:MAG: lysophospholipid acyltransferase family protein [Gemmatimonadetes bacterium]|nr:lysophospholipid acyltransferase family protein [Gemmatimonadota bacterium]